MKKVKQRAGRNKRLEKFERNNSKTIVVVPPLLKKGFPLPSSKAIVCSEEIEPPANVFKTQNPFTINKTHRCTLHRPSNEDFGQIADLPPDREHYYNIKPGTTNSEQKNACEGSVVQTRSAFVEPPSDCQMKGMMDDEWQTIENISDADIFLSRLRGTEDNEMPKEKKIVPNNIRISKTPHVKRIAEKFVTFKRNNIEVRKLEERVVCLEYDIFDLEAADPTMPTQKMRAFFSVKMKDSEGNNEKGNIPFIPSDVKRNFDIEDEDLQKLNKKEIEIIDEHIPENRSLLEDLKRVLRRKQALENKKKQPTLDLLSLYEMAVRESPPLNCDYSNTDLLSKAELQEIKDLILKKCGSSAHGINRRTVKCHENTSRDDAKCVLSNSLVCELMREAEVPSMTKKGFFSQAIKIL